MTIETSGTVLVGLIADTHGLLRPQALRALQDADHIIHAGDVGRPEVLEALARIAPLTVVRGNVDRGRWAERLPATAEVEVGGVWFHVLHVLDELDLDPRAAGFGVVVHGHSHRPARWRRHGVLYINPGSAGPRRFRLPVSLARIRIAGGALRSRQIVLDV